MALSGRVCRGVRHGLAATAPATAVAAWLRASVAGTNAPADGDQLASRRWDFERVERHAFELLSRCGLEFERSDGDCRITRPEDFDAAFPGTGGALYGRANHGAFTSFARPASRSKIGGLYLAGGSVHPGPGIPMATLSGRLAAARLHADLG